jgi:diaminopimelate decarboxylase
MSFHYVGASLYCESAPLEGVARAAGTPVYVYSRAAIAANFRRFDDAFGDRPHLVCYALKANGNLEILRLLHRLGAGFDIVSGGELFRVLKAGGDPGKVVFAGVGKTVEEIDAALQAGILKFNVESEAELQLLEQRAARLRRRAGAALRVNPDVDAATHPYISTGLRQHKFGVATRVAERLYLGAARFPHVEMTGISCHIGSQILSFDPFLAALDRILELAEKLRRRGVPLRYLDLGGGVGVRYRPSDRQPDPAAYVRRILARTAGLGYTILLEPGRAIIAGAGVLLTRVLYVKTNGRKNFVVVDAAMNDLLRPALYGAYHQIIPLRKPSGGRTMEADVVGPVCETGDFLARDRRLPPVKSGDVLAVCMAGAYGAVLGSNYNARPRPPEALVEGKRFRIIRRRETYDDLIRPEQ